MLDPRLQPLADLLVCVAVRELKKKNAAVVPAKETDGGVEDQTCRGYHSNAARDLGAVPRQPSR
jgi:hypothetical protein